MYAGFWKRFFAAIIDGIILNFTLFIAGYAIGYIFYGINDGELITIIYIMGFVATWLYHALLECSSKQATWGKQIIGIKVTNLNGGRVGFGQASGRYFGMFLSAITLGIGFIMVGFTKKKQGLHDIISSCLVVNKTYNIDKNNRLNSTASAGAPSSSIANDEIYYEQALEEFNSNRRQGAWIKILTENSGDEIKSKFDYIKLRVKDLSLDNEQIVLRCDSCQQKIRIKNVSGTLECPVCKNSWFFDRDKRIDFALNSNETKQKKQEENIVFKEIKQFFNSFNKIGYFGIAMMLILIIIESIN